MWQLADQHRIVQVAWSACQHRTWHAWLSPQDALEPVVLLQILDGMVVLSCGCTASERVREIWHQLGWSLGTVVQSLDLYHCTWHAEMYA